MATGKRTGIRYRTPNGSLIYGQNPGEFPKHHFSYLVSEIPAEEWALQVRFAGPDETALGFWRTREHSDLFALELIRSGTFEFLQNGKRYPCGPGDLFLVQIGGDSRMKTTSDYSLKKTVSLAGSALVPLLNSLNLAGVDVIRNTAPEIEEIFDTIFHLLKERPETYLHDLSLQAYHLLLTLSERCEARAYPELLNRMLRWVEGQFDSVITVEGIGRQFGVSSGTVFRLFRTFLKTSPMEYVIGLRMKHARILLLNSELPIKAIADRVGYRNPLYFSCEFHRLYGMPPREFRKRNLPE